MNTAWRDIWVDERGRLGRDCFVDLEGNPVERTPWSHPYSFDDHVLYKTDDFQKTDHFVYSDRMVSWDRDAFAEAVKTVWPSKPNSQIFDYHEPEDIERFLCLYNKKQVHLTAVLKGCNVSNGYPYWIFAYREENQGKK